MLERHFSSSDKVPWAPGSCVQNFGSAFPPEHDRKLHSWLMLIYLGLCNAKSHKILNLSYGFLPKMRKWGKIQSWYGSFKCGRMAGERTMSHPQRFRLMEDCRMLLIRLNVWDASISSQDSLTLHLRCKMETCHICLHAYRKKTTKNNTHKLYTFQKRSTDHPDWEERSQ